MRPGVPVLAAAAVPCRGRAAARGRVDADRRQGRASPNDARVTVVETHDIVLETTGRNTFRTFGLGADQAIRLTAMTRIGPDGEPHPLKAVDTVAGPDEYRYYDRGHVYFSIPPLGERVAVHYRFEYELIGAVAPAWAIAAGPGSRASDEQEFFWPWERVGHVVADWRRAWPALTTRYRFDHDVLLPSREGPGYTFRQIDYRLEYDTAWRDIAPADDIGAATHGAYRTHKVFDYLGTALPAQATTAPAAMRLASVAALPIAGTLGWLLVVAVARLRGGPPIDRTFVDTRILTRAPEEIAFWFDGTAARRRRRPGAPRRRGGHQHPCRSAGGPQLRGGERVRADAPAHAPRRGRRQPHRLRARHPRRRLRRRAGTDHGVASAAPRRPGLRPRRGGRAPAAGCQAG